MFKRLFILLLLLGSLVLKPTIASATQGTVTGTLTTPNNLVPIQNSTLTFQLNQAGVDVGNGYNLVPISVSCYTSTDGSVVGLPNPLVLPQFNVNYGSGTLPSNTYYVVMTYWNGSTETLIGPEVTVVFTGTGTLTITAPSLQPPNATGYNVYIGTSSGLETRQGHITGWSNYAQAVAITSGAVLPVSNNSVCQLTFNDAIIPTWTKYLTTLVDSNGNNFAGFPQYWRFLGSSVNLSTGYPVASDGDVRYPNPIISNPLSSYATQSINSSLTLNGFTLTAGAIKLPNNSSPPACTVNNSFIYTDNSGVLKACQNGNSPVSILNAASGGWSLGSTNIYNTTQTNRVMIGLGSSMGDFSSNLFDGSLEVNQFIYATDGTVTNASLLALGVITGSQVTTIQSGRSGSGGTYRPLTLYTNNTEQTRWDLNGHLLQNLTSTDISENHAIVSRDGIYVASGTSSASIGGMVYDNSSGTFRLVSGITGSGTVRPMAFVLYDTLTSTNDEAARITPIVNKGASADIFNLEWNDNVGSLSSDYHSPLVFQRNQNDATYVLAENPNTGNIVSVGYRALANDGVQNPDVYMGVSGNGFSTANGIVANEGFVISSLGATGGLALQSDAGTIKFLPGGSTVEMTLTVGSGVTLNHALPVTSGGTGNTGAWAGTGDLLFAGSTTTTTTSAHLNWDNSNFFETVDGGVALKSGTRHNPTGGTSYLHMFFDSSTPAANIVAVDYTGPAYKELKISGSTVGFNANGTDIMSIEPSGPAWANGFSTNASAGSTTLSLANTTFPGSVGGIPYAWLTVVAADGTVGYVPMWK